MIPWVRVYPAQLVSYPARSFVVDRHMVALEHAGDRQGEALDVAFRRFGGFVCVEWDVALDQDDVRAVEAAVETSPQSIWFARYRVWDDAGGHLLEWGLGCTWLPQEFLSRIPGLRELRWPNADGEIKRLSDQWGWEWRHVPNLEVKHVHW